MKNHLFKIIAICGLSISSQALSDFEVINLDKAYKQGFSGKGVEIGILDSGFVSSHPTLIYRAISAPFTKDNFHGTAVASVAVGNYLNPQTHGIAYQAKFYGLINSDSNVYDFFKYKNVKTINNSWGYMIYPVLNFQLGDKGQIEKYPNPLQVKDITGFEIGSIGGLKRLAKEKKTLIVFSTGNSGFTSAAIAATLPRYDESLRSWLAVGAIDSSQITKREDGKLYISPQGATNFGDGFKGIELFGLVAPGKDVKVAYHEGGYTTSSGTSFSSPMVSGVSALIQEKYPFLNGAQIADILLSTANKDYIAPKFVLKESIINNHAYYSVLYIDQPSATTLEQLIHDLFDVGYTPQSVQTILSKLRLIDSVTKEEVFGQGILDAKKALNGIATLDINRLNDENIFAHNDKLQGFYAFDTQGYSANFDNDISQRQWNEKYHLKDAINRPTLTDEALKTLNAGLIKTGRGTLTLRGNNSYAGDTLIQGGTLALNKHSNQGGTLTSSNVYVYPQGTLKGNGEIHQNLYNQGSVIAGNDDYGTLTVKQTYTQSPQGSLYIQFQKQPQAITFANQTQKAQNSKLTASTYTINGGSLLYTPSKNDFYANGEKIQLVFDEKFQAQLSQFQQILITPHSSQSLDFTILQDLHTLQIGRKPNAYTLDNDSLGVALRSIPSPNLSNNYQNFFAFLDSADIQTYNTTLKSIDSSLYLAQNSQNIQQQQALIFQTIANSLNPFAQDLINITPSYSYIHYNSHQGYNFSTTLFGKKSFTSSTLSGFIDFTHSRLDDTYANTHSNLVSFGLNNSYDLTYLDLFFGGSAGIGFNTFNHTITQQNAPLTSQYKNILAQTHLGIGKVIGTTLSFTPLAYLNYHYLYQDSFGENQDLLAKQYSSLHHHSLSTTLSLDLSYLFILDLQNNLKIGGFGNYEYFFLGEHFANQASFIDFPNPSFTQTYTFHPHLFNIGLNLEWSKKAFLLKFSPSIKLSNNFYAPQITLSLGAKL